MDPDEQTYHEIDLTQGDLRIQLVSDDRVFIAAQMRRWFTLFLDSSLRPIAVPPGLPRVAVERPVEASAPLAASVPVAPPPVMAEVSPVVALSSPSPQEAALLEQVQALQRQVAELAEQALRVQTPEVSPAVGMSSGVPAEETYPEPMMPVSNERASLHPSMPAGAISEEPSENGIDAFVSPAHLDMQGAFDAFESLQPERAPDIATYEQPVDNMPLSVENPEADMTPELLEIPTLLDVEAIDNSLHPPVENPLDADADRPFAFSEAHEPGAVPTSQAPASGEFEALLDSLMIDLEPDAKGASEAALPIAPTPVEASEGDNIQNESPTVPLESEEAVPESIPSLFGGPKKPVESAERPTLFPKMTGALRDLFRPQPASQATWAKEPTQSTAARMPSPTAPPDDLFETELKSIFEENPMPTPSHTRPDPDAPQYDAPRVAYDFGIPPIPPSADPLVRQLSLEALELQGSPFGNYDSPFPPLDERDDLAALLPEEAAESYQYKKADAPTMTAAKPVLPGIDGDTAFPEVDLSEDLGQIETLNELCEMAPHATTAADFLVLTAYFLSNMEHVEKFALKDLNSQLVRSGMTPINHAALETAVSQGYMQLVPDMTGTASTAEYTLTEAGHGFAESLFNV